MLRQRVLHLEHQRNQAWQEVKRLAKEPYRQDEESASLLPPEVRTPSCTLTSRRTRFFFFNIVPRL